MEKIPCVDKFTYQTMNPCTIMKAVIESGPLVSNAFSHSLIMPYVAMNRSIEQKRRIIRLGGILKLMILYDVVSTTGHQ